MSSMNEATRDQIIASDPAASTWLSANAGSGKTRVLTDRVARLLLRNVNPQRILCLTYTKAAASEMQNRLFKRLGAWAMLDDRALSEQLRELGEIEDINLDQARTLFARAIETPGGLKIQTIHSFCSALLRQFPLEAGVSPQFRELDEIGQRHLIDDVLDEMVLGGTKSVSKLASFYSGEAFSAIAASVAGNASKFAETGRQAIFAQFGVATSLTKEGLVEQTIEPDDLEFLSSLSPTLRNDGKQSDQKLALTFDRLPNLTHADAFDLLVEVFSYGSKAADSFGPKVGNLITVGLRKGLLDDRMDRFDGIVERIGSQKRLLLQLDAAEKTWALCDFASDFIPAYSEAKASRAVLDFDDLINRAKDLLTNTALAWVLYRLDGGIDHILVDEAQDTSPTQWRVIDALAAEITAGKGARSDTPRSLFVVGDKKQSIYSFQGADAREFDAMSEHFKDRLRDGPTMHERSLRYSFRSSPAILNVVDELFQGEYANGLGDDIEHKAFRSSLPGRVDVWDPVPVPDDLEETEWHDPVDRQTSNAPSVTLARQIAASIEEMIKTGSIPGESDDTRCDENGFRPITPGDILILVQGRGALFDNIIRECKKLDLPIAGADRLKVNAELAVRDLLALLSFLALQDDDLSLATTLRSPIFGWNDGALYKLAHGRPGRLWQQLRERREEYPVEIAVLDDLRSKSDFLRPYELLERILVHHSGRKALMARLGPEAEDGINELLNQALSYERTEVPSLTGFLNRAQSEDIVIKRQSDTSSGLIRVMTVHGAKGLEAPIVFLPDTIGGGNIKLGSFVMDENDHPMWNLSEEAAPDALKDAKELRSSASKEERQRLLYVALTRAKTWLVVCGAAIKTKPTIDWHTPVAEAVAALGSRPIANQEIEGARYEFGDWQTAERHESLGLETIPSVTPEFARTSVGMPPSRVRPINPSRLEGEKIVSNGTSGLSQEEALGFGTDVHKLLEVLPHCDPETWEAVASRIVKTSNAAIAVDAARGVIRAFPDLFASNTLGEVALSAYLSSMDMPMEGMVDRLVITNDRVRLIDFKTNSVVPDKEDEIPLGILRQMGVYLEAAEQIWPDKEISLEIVWTNDPRIMVVSHGIVRTAVTSATTS